MLNQCRTWYRGLGQGAIQTIAVLSTLVMSSAASSQPFSLICMPDPQYYTTSNHPSTFDLYRKQARWVRDNKSASNIQHVIWLGDLTNDNTLSQWGTADAAFTILDNAPVSYAVVPGNHDYKPGSGWPGAHLRNLTFYNNIVGPNRFNTKTWYGGNMGETNTRNENNYTYFSGNGINFLVIGLEYAPRKEVLTWANNLISQHPNHRVILFTHAFMTTSGNYSGPAGSSTGTVGAAGADIFTECANRHSNVFLVVCGHVTESVVNTRTGVSGNTLYEMLVDYQGEKILGTGSNLGNGWLRVLQFNPATNKINASTITVAPNDPAIFTNSKSYFYNGPYNKNPTSTDHLFSLNYNLGPMEPYTYLNASVGFHATGIANDLHSDQLDPDIAQADNGNWAAVWEDDSNNNGVYNIHLRGFDSDGNERFAKTTVNTLENDLVSATNPAMAMAADGRFVVVWQKGNTQVRMRSYNADGTPIGPVEEVVVTVSATGTVASPDVAMDDSGSFVVVWTDDRDGNGATQVHGRRFNFNNTFASDETTVNGNSAGNQRNPIVAMSATGDYVIAWEDNRGGTWDIGLRGYLADDTSKFPEALANSTTTGEQLSPDIAMDDTGRFVVIWEDDADLNSTYQVSARGFAANGTQLFSVPAVNINSAGNQLNPAVAMDSFGNWYPVWEDGGQGGEGNQMMSNAFNISGTRFGNTTTDVRANPVTDVSNQQGAPTRRSPVVSAHKSGRYLVAWSDDMDGNGNGQVLARGMAGTAKSLVVKSIGGTVTKSAPEPFYPANAQVTLTATGNPGSSFVRWLGDVPGGTTTANPLTITMNANKNITAQFTGTSRTDDWQLY